MIELLDARHKRKIDPDQLENMMNGSSLTAQQVNEIQALYNRGISPRAVARKYKITKSLAQYLTNPSEVWKR